MKHTVLVVEDDDALRISLGKLIRSLGCIAIVVGSAEKAIAYEKLEDIDVLLTDLSLPGMNGLLLAEALLLEYPRLGVIYMSGNADSAIELHGSLKPDGGISRKALSAC